MSFLLGRRVPTVRGLMAQYPVARGILPSAALQSGIPRSRLGGPMPAGLGGPRHGRRHQCIAARPTGPPHPPGTGHPDSCLLTLQEANDLASRTGG